MIAPEVFQLSEFDGHATALEGVVPEALRAHAEEAVRSCPERAISSVTPVGGKP
jgi:ferredoxin